MENFIFHKALKSELQFIIDKSDKLDGVLCFYGEPGCGKTSFSNYYANLVSKEVSVFDANSHLFDKSSASNILKDIKDSGRKSLASFMGDEEYNGDAYWDRCFIIDEFHNLAPNRQEAYKVSLEKLSKQLNALFILIVNTSKEKPLNKTLTPAILSRVQPVDFDIKKHHFDEVTDLVKEKYPVLDKSYIENALPDLRQIVKRAKLLA